MEYRDNIFQNIDALDETLVWILLSDSAMLTNQAIENIKDSLNRKNKFKQSVDAIPTSIMSTMITDIASDEMEDTKGLATCSIEEVWKRPNKTLNGKWWCSVSYENLNKKDRANLFAYLKNPSKNVCLVVTVSEYKNCMEFKKNRLFANSNCCHLLNLQFPSRAFLMRIVKELFLSYNAILSEDEVNSFIMKMSTSYEEYKDCVEKIVTNLKTLIVIPEDEPIEIPVVEFNQASKGIEHFEINDLLRYMTKPLTSNKTLNGRRKIHKTVARLLESTSAKDLCVKLKFRIIDMLVYRAAINNGYIPVKVPYSVSAVQESLPDDELNSKIKKASAFAFKRNAYIANLTSIEDWLYMYSILENVSYTASDDEYLAVLLRLINRTAVSTDRLMNNIGIKNTLEENLVYLNGLTYSKWFQKMVN